METENQIHRVFSLFDHDNDGHIAKRELSTVLRLLGRNPTNEEIILLVIIYYIFYLNYLGNKFTRKFCFDDSLALAN